MNGATDRTSAEQIVAALGGELRNGRAMVRCVAHEDRSPSLSITDAGDRTLLRCFAGCTQAEVIAALRARGLWSGGKTYRPVPVRAKPRDPRKGRWIIEDIHALDDHPPAVCVWAFLQDAAEISPLILDLTSRALRKHRPSSTPHVKAWFDCWFSGDAESEIAA